jgi:formate/nitrite transporter FocA (FNT family)
MITPIEFIKSVNLFNLMIKLRQIKNNIGIGNIMSGVFPVAFVYWVVYLKPQREKEKSYT